jgi:PAS domain S-box-containing protein
MNQPAQKRAYEVVNTAIPVRDAHGCVVMAVVRMRDVTEQKKTLRALELSEERYVMAMRAIDAMVYDWDVATGRVERSDAIERILGFRCEEAEPTLEWWRLRIHPEDRSESGSQVEAELLKHRRRHKAEYRIRHRDGHWVNVEDRGIVIYDDAGRPRRVVGSTVDITPTKRAQQALRESEERYRTLVENASDIVAMMDLKFRFTSVNPAVERVLGYAPEEILGTPLAQYVPDDQLTLHQEMLARKMNGAATTQYEMVLYGKDRQRRFVLEVNSKLLLDANNVAVGIHAIARDITERKDAEARQLILLRELQHRTKNMLAVVQSIASQTLTRSPNLARAHEDLLGRLHALAHAQEFVVAGPAAGVAMRVLVEAELEPFAARARIEGDTVLIGARFAQSLALVIHELATNAIKHGALSVEGGDLEITWAIEKKDQTEVLNFLWLEQGGPPVRSPRSVGFGTTILRTIGGAILAYKKTGFEYRFSVPLADVVASVEEGPQVGGGARRGDGVEGPSP